MKESERERWREYRRTGDVKLRNELMTPYTYIADELARKYYNNSDDSRQDALVGLVVAANSYDPDSGSSFAAWARHKMRYEIINAYRELHNTRSKFKVEILTENQLPEGDGTIDRAPDTRFLPDDETIRRETVGEVRASLSVLSRHQRAAIDAVFYDGANRKKYAQFRGVSLNCVNNSIAQSYHKLRYMLKSISDV